MTASDVISFHAPTFFDWTQPSLAPQSRVLFLFRPIPGPPPEPRPRCPPAATTATESAVCGRRCRRRRGHRQQRRRERQKRPGHGGDLPSFYTRTLGPAEENRQNVPGHRAFIASAAVFAFPLHLCPLHIASHENPRRRAAASPATPSSTQSVSPGPRPQTRLRAQPSCSVATRPFSRSHTCPRPSASFPILCSPARALPDSGTTRRSFPTRGLGRPHARRQPAPARQHPPAEAPHTVHARRPARARRSLIARRLVFPKLSPRARSTAGAQTSAST